MNQMFAVGKVQNGRITIMGADGKGFSRPIVRTVETIESGVAFTMKATEEKIYPSVPAQENNTPVDVMPWIRRYMDKKRVDYVEPKKPTVLSRLAQYIKEEFI